MPLSHAERIISGERITRDEARAFLDLPRETLPDILAAASRVRRHFKGNGVVFCSIVNAKSGRCSENCIFCAQSAHHKTKADIYPLKTPGELQEAARADAENAAYFGIVTSGRGSDEKECAVVAETIRGMVAAGIPVKPCASLGIVGETELAALKAAGLTRYHHNLEVSRNFFPRLCSTHSWEERVATVRAAQKIGLSTCVGGIFGVGESVDDRVDFLFEVREVNPDSVPLNFLVPIPGTPLEAMPPFDMFEAIKIIALARLVMPDKDIKAAGGRIEVFGGDQALIFLAGANSAISGNLLTVKGRNPGDDLLLLEKLGLEATQ